MNPAPPQFPRLQKRRAVSDEDDVEVDQWGAWSSVTVKLATSSNSHGF